MNTAGVHIVHEIRGRLRLRCRVIGAWNFDPAYLEALLENIDGVEQVRVNPTVACVVVYFDGAPDTRGAVFARLEHLPEEVQRFGRRRPASNPVVLAGLGIFALVGGLLPAPLGLAASLLVASPILVTGLVTLFTRGVKVEVLDAAVVGFSLARRDLFTANVVVFLLTLGSYLEELSEQRSTGLLRSLLRPRVEEVWVERDGVEVGTPVDAVRIGDIVVCGPGEMIPVDGRVESGDALVNQASITGESVPVHVSAGSEVLSGSVLEEGRLRLRADRVGSETGLARISSFLETSLATASVSQRHSEELADRLVPLTFGLGMGIYVLTRDPRRAAAVLTVDYSCAVKLANPVAVKSAMYTAARLGVLLKGSQAMDSLAAVDTIVFDKTGTLTTGVLRLAEVIPLASLTADELLALAAGAEEHYAHPVARAVVREARARGLSLPAMSQVDFIVAHGVSAYVDGSRVLVGSRHFIEEDEGIDCAAADELRRRLHAEGKSLLFIARDERLEGVIALCDDVRPEAAAVLAGLKQSGIQRIVVLTGDHCDMARALAAELEAVDEVHWELKPEQKAAIVARLQGEGRRLAFAGDGVNDAPALVSAEVGICMPGGADLARNAAQVVLLKDDLRALLVARLIARHTRRTIERGFAAAVGGNTAFLLLAGMGAISPVTAALLHNLNTVGILAGSGYAGLRYRPGGDGDHADKVE
jgi:Cu2+-exporting ATPase